MAARVVVDSSAWVDFLTSGAADVRRALSDGVVVLPPLVIAELITGATSLRHRETIGELFQEVPLHPTPLAHWLAVGDLRRALSRKGVNVTVPDAHIAQCAIDLDALLITRDSVFGKIARHTSLRLSA